MIMIVKTPGSQMGSPAQQKLWAEELRSFMRMMPEAWAFRRGQARLVVPTWGNTAPDLACVVIFCTPIESRRGIECLLGRGENLCFRFGGTKYLKVRNTEANWANREIPWRLM